MALFGKNSIGLDIADHTIEVVESAKSSLGGIQILKTGRIMLEPGIVSAGRIINPDGLKKKLITLFVQAKPRPIKATEICFGLPDSQIYTHVFTLRPHKIEERDRLVLEEAKANIPLNENDLLYAYKVLASTPQGVEILLVATSEEVVNEWQDFFSQMGITVKTFDLESLAILRGLSLRSPQPVIVLDIGSVTTNIFIFNPEGLNYAHSLNLAGDYLNQKIAAALGVNLIEAEAKKIKYGLAYPKENIYPVITGFLDEIAAAIKESINYYEGKNAKKIGGFVLVGGTSQMFGLLDYLQKALNKPGLMGSAKLTKNRVPLEYVEAVGLAIRNLDAKYKDDPAIILNSKISEKKMAKQLEVELEKSSEISANSFPGEPGESGENNELLESLAPPKIKEEHHRSELLILMDIVIAGIILVGIAWQYGNYNSTQKQVQIQKTIVHYDKLQTFNFKIDIAISGSEFLPKRVKSHIIRETVYQAPDFNTALVSSTEMLAKDMLTSENNFKDPLNKALLQKQNSYPLVFEWLVYDQRSYLDALDSAMDSININRVSYVFNSLENTNVETTDNPGLLKLSVVVKAYVSDTIPQ